MSSHIHTFGQRTTTTHISLSIADGGTHNNHPPSQSKLNVSLANKISRAHYFRPLNIADKRRCRAMMSLQKHQSRQVKTHPATAQPETTTYRRQMSSPVLSSHSSFSTNSPFSRSSQGTSIGISCGRIVVVLLTFSSRPSLGGDGKSLHKRARVIQLRRNYDRHGAEFGWWFDDRTLKTIINNRFHVPAEQCWGGSSSSRSSNGSLIRPTLRCCCCYYSC